jgi:hypothetical protein
LVAVPGGIVMACVAGAIRTREALPDFIAYNNGADVSAFLFVGTGGEHERDVADQILALPQWDVVGEGRPVVLSVRRDGHWVSHVPIGIGGAPYLRQLDRPLLVEGRLPDPDRAEELYVNEAFAEAIGVHAGDHVELRTVTPGGLDASSSGQQTCDPDGENIIMTVTGIGRRPTDLSFENDVNADVFGAESWFSVVGPAFLERFGDRLASYGMGVQGRAKPGRSAELAAALSGLGVEGLQVQEGSEFEEVIGSIERGVDFQVNALLLFALVAAITTVALASQAIGRRALLDLDGDTVLRASGGRRTQRAAVPMVRAVVVAIVGAGLAVGFAVAGSTLFPTGLAGRAAVDEGVDVDVTVLTIGAVAIIAVTLLVSVFSAWRGTGRSSVLWRAPGDSARVSTLSTTAAAVGAPVTAVYGMRMAVERGRGRTSVPVVGAALAAISSVLVLTAILVFAASVDHLVTTPSAQGWTWDASVANLNDLEAVGQAEDALRSNPVVDDYLGVATGPLVVDGEDVYVAAFGHGEAAGPELIDGRLPRADDEVVLGHLTLDDIHKQIGDTVVLALAPGAPEVRAEIVGSAVLPATLDSQLTFGRGALMTGEGYALINDPSQPFVPNTFLVDYVPGTSASEGLAGLREDFGATVGPFLPSEETQNIKTVQDLPRVLSVLVGLLALGTLANVLLTSVRRRRRDLALFATLGFRRRQLAATVAWQATTFALLALLVGLPLGVAAGRTTWGLVATSLGLDVAPILPVAWLTAVALIAILAANLIAAVPARSAARTRPAEVLRDE